LPGSAYQGMTNRAVIIGAGGAGLTTAALLARLDYEVVLVEQATHTAPLLRGFQRRNVYCDVGLHYSGGLAPGGLLSRLFGCLDVDCEAVSLSNNGFDHVRWPEWDLEVNIPVGLGAFEESLSTAFPNSARAVQAWVEVTRKVLEQTPFLNPEVPPWQTSRVLSERISLAAHLRDAGAEPRLIGFLGRYGENLFGLGAEEAPMTTHAAVVGSYLRSAHAIRGGGQALAEAMTDRLESLGARLITSQKVEGITTDDEGRATAVVLAGGESLPADVVVFTPHPALLPDLFAEGKLHELYERRMRKLENTPAMFVTYLRSKQTASVASHNTYLFFEEAESDASPVSQLAVMAGSPPSEDLESSLCLICDVPPDVFAAVPRSSRAYRDAKSTLSTKSIQLARQWTDVIGSDADVVETLSPLSFEHWTGTQDGSAYGAKRMVTGRRLHCQTAVANLFLAGQSVLYPGIMGVVASGLVATCHVAGMESTWELLSG